MRKDTKRVVRAVLTVALVAFVIWVTNATKDEIVGACNGGTGGKTPVPSFSP